MGTHGTDNDKCSVAAGPFCAAYNNRLKVGRAESVSCLCTVCVLNSLKCHFLKNASVNPKFAVDSVLFPQSFCLRDTFLMKS